MANWSCQIAVTALFLPLRELYSSFAFLILIVPLFFCTVFLSFRLPESRGEHTADLAEKIAGRNTDERKPIVNKQ